MDNSYDYMSEGARGAKMWTRGVDLADNTREQIRKIMQMPFIFKHVAVMPDAHVGIGATIGTVLPTIGAIIPGATGVDLGCGMIAQRLNLSSHHLPDNLRGIRNAIEKAVPHGRTDNGRLADRGAWPLGKHPDIVEKSWLEDLDDKYSLLCDMHPLIKTKNNAPIRHLGTLGTGNHFIEVCLDESEQVWVMLHSGSRGAGNRIGAYFIEKAKEEMRRWFINLPDQDLAYLSEGSQFFNDYMAAVAWAQDWAFLNRHLMMEATIQAISKELNLSIAATLPNDGAINCHHNYVTKEHHFNKNIWITRKGAIRARQGDLGIIPGSMGAKSFIVEGLGNTDSFMSCSHGAGRVMSRTEARRRITVERHKEMTAGVECRKDDSVLDESPDAYKSIDAVMQAQKDLVTIKHTLRQVVCVKG
jgi:tRNA-splicing ligase RtcB (3'-phosphate/5'-hydroxy nucleic acid ligase)